MFHEPAASETSLLSRLPPEKLVAAALVALLHLVLIWFLLRATIIQVAPPALLRALPITVWLKPAPAPKPPQPKEKERKNKVEGAPPVSRAIGPILPAPSAAPPASEYNGLRALGRYLHNCSAGDYEALSTREWKHCLGNQWAGPAELPLRLAPEPQSRWKLELEKRKAPPRKVEHECDQNSFNAHLGLPCYNYGN